MNGDDGLGEELAGDLDPDAWVWLPGVDYAAGWREARDAAEGLNEILAACGVDRRHLRAVADTDAQGRGWVLLVGVPSGWDRLAELLWLAVEESRRKSA
ncbi:hypothetical protein [Kitasatospora cinereorecta]|uniref:Uncharacterized protein n=1 Tax=Kitasatospora cinereorecta TaxID=285560 RepID=A0ABW0VES6_9ACTN